MMRIIPNAALKFLANVRIGNCVEIEFSSALNSAYMRDFILLYPSGKETRYAKSDFQFSSVAGYYLNFRFTGPSGDEEDYVTITPFKVSFSCLDNVLAGPRIRAPLMEIKDYKIFK